MSDNNTIYYAGDFRLKTANLISYRTGEVKEKALRFDILPQILVCSIVEDISLQCITGELDIADGQDIRSTLPITGMERLELHVFTPGQREIRFTEDAGEPFYVYKIEKIKTSGNNKTTQVYRLHFTSREAYKNSTTRISKAFSGPIENAVWEIVKSEDILDSNKSLFLEESNTNTKVVIPNLKPFAAINMLGSRAQSAMYKNAGYLFYETVDGFHFRTLESLMATGGVDKRRVKETYNLSPIVRKEGNRDIEKDRQVIQSFEFVNPVNMLYEVNNGMLGNKIVTNDIYNKTIKTTEFDYHNTFEDYFHTEGKNEHFMSPFTNFDGGYKSLSEYSDAKLMNLTNTSKIHDDYERISNDGLHIKASQRMQMSGFHLILNVVGQTDIGAGDLISFDLPLQKSGDDKGYNPYYSGRYIILQCKHNFDVITQKHGMTLRCMKDSTFNELPIELFQPIENRKYGSVMTVEALDNATLKRGAKK